MSNFVWCYFFENTMQICIVEKKLQRRMSAEHESMGSVACPRDEDLGSKNPA